MCGARTSADRYLPNVCQYASSDRGCDRGGEGANARLVGEPPVHLGAEAHTWRPTRTFHAPVPLFAPAFVRAAGQRRDPIGIDGIIRRAL